MTASNSDPPAARSDLVDVKYVGTTTAETLAEAGIEAADITGGTATYADLVEAGIDEGVATKIQREFDLADRREAVPNLLDVKYVGRTTAAALAEAGIEAADITGGAVTYADLLEAGVDHGIATKIQREYDLADSPAPAGGDLGRLEAAVDELAADLEAVRSDLEARRNGTDDRLEQLERRLDRVAERQASLSERQERLLESFERAQAALDSADLGE